MTVLHYFNGRGRAETTRWMLAANQVAFENAVIETPAQMAALRASGLLPFDQIPLLEIDGHAISQSSAMIRYLARRGDLYGDTSECALWCDMTAGVAADLSEAPMQAAFLPTPEQAHTLISTRFAKFAPLLEARLNENATGFVAGRRLTFADIVLAEALSGCLDRVPDLLDPYLGLANLYRHVTGLPGIAAYLASPQRHPVPDDEYVIDVARVLQRALPSHFPEADRFVLSQG